MNGNRTLKVILATLLGAGTSGEARQRWRSKCPISSSGQCRFCPFPGEGNRRATPDASVLNVSDDSARFGDYTGLDEDGRLRQCRRRPDVPCGRRLRRDHGRAQPGPGFALHRPARRTPGEAGSSICRGMSCRGASMIRSARCMSGLGSEPADTAGRLGARQLRVGLALRWMRTCAIFTLGWDRKSAGLGLRGRAVRTVALRGRLDPPDQAGPRPDLGQFPRRLAGARQAARLPDR
jgi:hypothetical protein